MKLIPVLYLLTYFANEYNKEVNLTNIFFLNKILLKKSNENSLW